MSTISACTVCERVARKRKMMIFAIIAIVDLSAKPKRFETFRMVRFVTEN